MDWKERELYEDRTNAIKAVAWALAFIGACILFTG